MMTSVTSAPLAAIVPVTVPEVSLIPLAGRVLLQVWWTDCTNVAGGWHDAEDLATFATNGAWECSNTGWLVYEDDRCYILAGRMTDDGRNVGLVERIPKGAVTAVKALAGPVAAGLAGLFGTISPGTA